MKKHNWTSEQKAKIAFEGLSPVISSNRQYFFALFEKMQIVTLLCRFLTFLKKLDPNFESNCVLTGVNILWDWRKGCRFLHYLNNFLEDRFWCIRSFFVNTYVFSFPCLRLLSSCY